MTVNKEFYRLSKEDEDVIEGYIGVRHTLSDGKGNVLEETDTRTVEKHALKVKKDLKRKVAEAYSEAFPQHKIDAARADTLNDSVEKAAILALDTKLQREYSLRKAKMLEAAAAEDIDLLEEVALSNEWQVVDKPNWLTLGLTKRYFLEKVVEEEEKGV